MLTPERIAGIVAVLPDEWLATEEIPIAERRRVYTEFLTLRIASSHIFVKGAQDAR
jgi:hypothetical protein